MEQSEFKRVSNQQILARTYIEENEIDRIFNDMLNSLVHEKAKDPVIYMIKYLAGLITNEERKQAGLIIPGPYPKSQPIAKYPHLSSNCTSILNTVLTKPLFNSIKFLKTKHGGNINHILKQSESNPKDPIGCLLTDGDCLPVFNELFTPIIHQVHLIDKAQSQGDFAYDKTSMDTSNKAPMLFLPFYKDIQEKIKSFKVSYSRNIKNYSYCNTITDDKRSQVESEMVDVIDMLIKDKTIGDMKRISYKTDQEKWNEILSYVAFDVEWNQKAQMANYWPENRSIYYTEDLSTVILINFNDHLLVISVGDTQGQRGVDLNSIIMSTRHRLNAIEKHIQFDYSRTFGYMNSSLMLLGAGMTISACIEVQDAKLAFKDGFTLIDLLKKMQFDSVSISNSNAITLSSSFKLAFKTEKDFIESFYSKLSGILHLNQSKANDISKDLSFTQFEFPNDTNTDDYIKSAYEATYEELQYALSSSGLNINSLINHYINHPNNKYGIILQDATQLIAFKPFISKYLSLSQQYDILTGKRLNDSVIKQATSSKGQLNYISISLIRNIDSYPFPSSYLNQNANVESLIINALNTLNMKELFGNYFSLEKANEKDQAMKIIKENKLQLSQDQDSDKELCNELQPDFPSNRGVIQFAIDNSFAIVNDIDHLKFYINVDNPNNNLNEYLYMLLKLLNEFCKQIKFASSQSFGIVSACPRLLGTGLTLTIELDLELNKINKELAQQRIDNKEYDYSIDSNGKLVLSNKITIGRSENEIFCHMIYTINSLID